jgi:hypothetical protein
LAGPAATRCRHRAVSVTPAHPSRKEAPSLMSTARRTFRTLLATAVAAVLVSTLLPSGVASAKSYSVDKRFFGVHDSDLTSWPAVSPGSVRLWDAGVTWREIETSPGVYDFSRLDALVRAANARRAEVTLVLGMTPSFYSPDGRSSSMPSSLAAWNNYVRAVATHYSAANWGGTRGIAAYQVWNEANVVNFWTGTPYQMAQLTKATWNTVKSVDKGALVLSPAFAARINEQIRGIQRFAFARVGGVPAWKFTNAIGLNLYPLDKYGSSLGTPEKSMALLKRARKLLGYGGMPASKPIWNTEVNFGMRTGAYGGTAAVVIPEQRQAAYVLRTYLLNAANGIKRVDWYAWDLRDLPAGGTLGNTRLTDPTDGVTPTLAGKAFGLAQSWLLKGTLVGPTKSTLPCTTDKDGTYTCVIRYAHGYKRVYWNPIKTVRVRAAKGATFKVGVFGVRNKVRSGGKIKVDYRPVMVRSKH